MIAIHDGSGWNRIWIGYCRQNAIPHKVVNAYSSSIIDDLREARAFLWHFHHNLPQDLLIARSVLNAAEQLGLVVFPDYHTNWHFDDKVAQKYMFEAADLPAAPAWTFFDMQEALSFAAQCDLPIVAKLRRGAGSHNVRLLRTRSAIRGYIRRMFGRGYAPRMRALTDIRRKVRTAGSLRSVVQRLQRIPAYLSIVRAGKAIPRERAYVYFQEFVPGNDHDIRISVVGGRAWGFRRRVRSADFRASGSGVVDYDQTEIPIELFRMSMDAAESLSLQSAAFDWVRDPAGHHYIVEVSYGYVDSVVAAAPGYRNRNMEWVPGHYSPAQAVIEDLMQKLRTAGKVTVGANGPAE